jgi:hypothetical protein
MARCPIRLPYDEQPWHRNGASTWTVLQRSSPANIIRSFRRLQGTGKRTCQFWQSGIIFVQGGSKNLGRRAIRLADAAKI